MGSRDAWAVVALTAAVCLVYLRVVRFELINFDDPLYVASDAPSAKGLAWPAIRHVFSTMGEGNYIPLTWMSHLATVELAGLNPAWHHAVNLFLHALATGTLYIFLRRATGATGRSFLVAALFGVHPLHVESVAWVAERKDVLSGWFWMLGLVAYLGFVHRRTAGRYLLIVLAFTAGLLSKPMVVTFPFVLLLLDYWPLRRWRPAQEGEPLGRLVLEKLPLILLAVGASLSAVIAQRSVGALSDVYQPSAADRVLNALASYVTYAIQSIWPAGLAVFYPPRAADSLWTWGGLGAAFLVVGSGLVWTCRRRCPYLVVGWLWYLGTLVPVIGLVQVGAQSRADRYLYLPQIGLLIAAAWTLADLAGSSVRLKRGRPAAAVAACFVYGALAWHQTGYWRSSETVFRHALEVTDNNARAHDYYAQALLDRGDVEGAISQFNRAIDYEPYNPQPRYNLAVAYRRAGKVPQAQSAAMDALSVDPQYTPAHFLLGTLALNEGALSIAADQFQRVLDVNPEAVDARVNMGIVQAQLGHLQGAEDQLRQAVILAPQDVAAHYNLAMVLMDAGRRDEAQTHLRTVLRLQPGHEKAQEALDRLRDSEDGTSGRPEPQ